MPNTSKFAPDSFFFTDPGAITQSLAQAFGPVSADEFRLTTKFSVTAAPKAFAICTGVILVQPQTDSSTKVNLILRPFKQPIVGLNIKYFIYRGLNKSDFFSGDLVKSASETTSDFINNINAAFTAFYTKTDPGGTVPPFEAKFIGFDPTNQPDTLPLSGFFFKQSEYTGSTSANSQETTQTAFDLPMIAAGSWLGNFATGECGIDIVLDYGDYSLPSPNDEFVFDLAYARTDEYLIDMADETGDFNKKLAREQIFQFLDAAAYYGFHDKDGGTVTLNSAGTKIKKSGSQIYTDVIQNFYTKNCLYLYIQSDRTRSYNFYENYFIDDQNINSLKIGPTPATLTAAAYGTNGWPLLIDKTPQTHNNPDNTLCLQLVTDNNVNTMLYGQAATITNAQGNNFCDADNLKLPDNADGTPSNLTKIITLSNPSAGANGAKLNVANFNVLIYQGIAYSYVAGQTTDDQNVTSDLMVPVRFIDDIFGSLNAVSLFKTNESYYSTIAMQRIKLINYYADKVRSGISAVQTLVINDTLTTGIAAPVSLDRVIYSSESIDIFNEVTSITGTITSNTRTSATVGKSATGTNTFKLPAPFYYDLTNFTDDTQTIVGLNLNSTDATAPSKVLVGLTKTENDSLLALINANSLSNSRLVIAELFDNGNQLISVENILYQKFKAGIIGEDTNGKIKAVFPAAEITVYSLDRKYHHSKAFSDYVKKDDSVNTLILDLDISL